ncbi:hypothetical protein C8J56DRAFT_748562, partial [Mycena floridula]
EQTGKVDVEASNRYLTPSNDIGPFRVIPLGGDLDPYGYLQKAAREKKLVHTEDNAVECFRMTTDENGDTQFRTMPIENLRKGDAVELSISLVAFPVKDDCWRVFVVLRGVNLLDDRFSK